MVQRWRKHWIGALWTLIEMLHLFWVKTDIIVYLLESVWWPSSFICGTLTHLEGWREGENTCWGGCTVLNPKGLEISLPFPIIVFLYAPSRLDTFCWLEPKLHLQAFLLPFSEHTDSDGWLVQAQVFSKKVRVHEQWWFPQDTVQQDSIVLQSFYLPGKRFKVPIYVSPPAQPSKKPESLRRILVFVCWLRKKEFFF